jgi:hypothetical protein
LRAEPRRAKSPIHFLRADTLESMGIAYRLDKAQGLMTIVWDGQVTAGDWRSHLEAVFADPDWPAGPRNLSDLRSADISAITASDTDEIVAMYAPHLDKVRGMKSAAVAGDNFETSSEFESQNQPPGLSLIVFNDLLNACTWLGVDKAAAQATITELRLELRGQPAL